MEKQRMLAEISKIHPVSSELASYLSKHVTEVFYKKGQPVKIPSRDGNVWYVLSGMVKRCYFDSSGKEHITRFWKEHELIVYKESEHKGLPDSEFLIMIEDCRLYKLSTVCSAYILKNFQESFQLLSMIYRMDLSRIQILNYLLVLPLAEAYEKFLKIYPAARLPLKDIASYLDSTPKSISRLRSKR